jgi:hypothetical protein
LLGVREPGVHTRSNMRMAVVGPCSERYCIKVDVDLTCKCTRTHAHTCSRTVQSRSRVRTTSPAGSLSHGRGASHGEGAATITNNCLFSTNHRQETSKCQQ